MIPGDKCRWKTWVWTCSARLLSGAIHSSPEAGGGRTGDLRQHRLFCYLYCKPDPALRRVRLWVLVYTRIHTDTQRYTHAETHTDANTHARTRIHTEPRRYSQTHSYVYKNSTQTRPRKTHALTQKSPHTHACTHTLTNYSVCSAHTHRHTHTCNQTQM